MPRSVAISDKIEAIRLIKEGKTSQRDIAKITGISRPYLRNLSTSLGHQFPRNGLEQKGTLTICDNCFVFMRKPPSRMSRAKNHYCSAECRSMHKTGVNHQNWDGGKASGTFSSWLVNQSGYKRWREEVLERDNYTCQVTGLKINEGDADVHHIKPKAQFQDLALDVSNGLTVSKTAHRMIHKLITEGCTYEDAVIKAKEFLSKGS